jgi:prolyl-tRNA synthetase
VSTRLLGAVVMTHGDDVGLKLPPTIAPKQVVVVSLSDDTDVVEACDQLMGELSAATFRSAPLRAHFDRRDLRPVARKWEWLTKGAPIVVEIGRRDLEDGCVTLTTRAEAATSPRGSQVPRASAAQIASDALETLQSGYLEVASRRLVDATACDVHDYETFRSRFEDDPGIGFIRAAWCGDGSSEELLEPFKASIRCLPFDQPAVDDLGPCVLTGRPAVTEAIFARSY